MSEWSLLPVHRGQRSNNLERKNMSDSPTFSEDFEVVIVEEEKIVVNDTDGVVEESKMTTVKTTLQPKNKRSVNNFAALASDSESDDDSEAFQPSSLNEPTPTYGKPVKQRSQGELAKLQKKKDKKKQKRAADRAEKSQSSKTEEHASKDQPVSHQSSGSSDVVHKQEDKSFSAFAKKGVKNALDTFLWAVLFGCLLFVISNALNIPLSKELRNISQYVFGRK